MANAAGGLTLIPWQDGKPLTWEKKCGILNLNSIKTKTAFCADAWMIT